MRRMDSTLVSWGYARRRKHLPIHTNPFKELWVEINGVFVTNKTTKQPQVGDRVIVVDRSDSNVTYHNMPIGATGVLMRIEPRSSGRVYKVLFDDFRGHAINNGCIWVHKGIIEVL